MGTGTAHTDTVPIAGPPKDIVKLDRIATASGVHWKTNPMAKELTKKPFFSFTLARARKPATFSARRDPVLSEGAGIPQSVEP